MYCYIVVYMDDKKWYVSDPECCIFLKREDADWYADKLNKKYHYINNGISNCYLVDKIEYSEYIKRKKG